MERILRLVYRAGQAETLRRRRDVEGCGSEYVKSCAHQYSEAAPPGHSVHHGRNLRISPGTRRSADHGRMAGCRRGVRISGGRSRAHVPDGRDPGISGTSVRVSTCPTAVKQSCFAESDTDAAVLEKSGVLLGKLASVGEVRPLPEDADLKQYTTAVAGGTEIFLLLDELVDKEKEIARLTGERRSLTRSFHESRASFPTRKLPREGA